MGNFNDREPLQCHKISVTPETELQNIVRAILGSPWDETPPLHAGAGNRAGGVDSHHDVTVDSGRTVEIGEEPAK